MDFGRSERTERERMQKRQRDAALHQQQAGRSGADGLSQDLVREIVGSDLDSGIVSTLDNLASDDWALANLTDAETHEARWLSRVLALAVQAAHPPGSAVLTGEHRAWLLADEQQALEPLDDSERAMLRSYLLASISRMTRARGGWQQEQLNKSITESRVVDDEDSSETGGWL